MQIKKQVDVGNFAKDVRMEMSEKWEENLCCLYIELSANVDIIYSLKQKMWI